MQLPSSLIPLDRWKVYKGKLPPGSDKKHRIIIMTNADNLNYLYVTTKVEKAKRIWRDDLASIVEVEPEDWDCITEPSCVKCTKKEMCSITESEFKDMYTQGELELLGDLPDNIKTKIISAICSSLTYSPQEKKFYTL
ncbi:MAG: hypothetical protein IJ479_02370 [Alphaproteobacteria bacterium]|nr:hypothetical protein [Alphaproteobacteria bacterium]